MAGIALAKKVVLGCLLVAYVCLANADSDDECTLLQESVLTKTSSSKSRVQASGDSLGLAEVSAVAATTTLPPTGLVLNSKGQLTAFLAATQVNVVTMIVCICIFMCLRTRYPMMYSHNVLNGSAPMENYKEEWTESSWGWLRASFSYDVGDRWLRDDVNLDGALTLDQTMLIEFSNLAMKIIAIVGVPLLCILGPIHYFFGHNAAGADTMSYLSFGNVQSCNVPEPGKTPDPDFPNCWIYDVHVVFIWFVCVVVVTSVYSAMDRFVKYRQKWLLRLPEPQATTLMVEDIPQEYQSDKKLLALFTQLLGDKVKTCHVVKYMPELTYKLAELETANNQLKVDEAKLASGEVMADTVIAKQKSDIEALKQQIKELRAAAVKDAAEEKVGVNCAAGFVQFKTSGDAEIAKNLQFFPDADDFRLTTPPDPTSIIFHDLQKDPNAGAFRVFLGYCVVAGLFFVYLPLVLGITSVATAVNLGPLQPVWAGLAPSFGLTIMVSFLPTILILIFRTFFTLKADIYAQKSLQTWYFFFQVVFVILATAVGASATTFVKTLATAPFSAFALLGGVMPHATHFYMNFLVLQWVTHCMVIMRYVLLTKFLMFRKMYGSDEEGKAKAEPEDQDYYGMGSRSARFAICLCIGIVYGTLSPPVNLLCFVEFFVCRCCYGYLLPFAEKKKPDLGGAFFVDQLRHLFTCLIIYTVLMIGVLMLRSATIRPLVAVAPTLFYVIWAMKRFERKYTWESLPYKVMVENSGKAKGAKSAGPVGSYVQPELRDS